MRPDFPYVHWIEFNERNNVFRSRIGTLLQVIIVKICQNQSGWWDFSRSHDIKTPLQIDPYAALRPCATPEDALRQAITGLTMYYGMAIKANHKPCEDWLHPVFKLIDCDA